MTNPEVVNAVVSVGRDVTPLLDNERYLDLTPQEMEELIKHLPGNDSSDDGSGPQDGGAVEAQTNTDLPVDTDPSTSNDTDSDAEMEAPAPIDSSKLSDDDRLIRGWIGFYYAEDHATAKREGWEDEYVANAKFIERPSGGYFATTDGQIIFGKDEQLLPHHMLLSYGRPLTSKELAEHGRNWRLFNCEGAMSDTDMVGNVTWGSMAEEFEREWLGMPPDYERPDLSVSREELTYKGCFRQDKANQEVRMALLRREALMSMYSQFEHKKKVIRKSCDVRKRICKMNFVRNNAYVDYVMRRHVEKIATIHKTTLKSLREEVAENVRAQSGASSCSDDH